MFLILLTIHNTVVGADDVAGGTAAGAPRPSTLSCNSAPKTSSSSREPFERSIALFAAVLRYRQSFGTAGALVPLIVIPALVSPVVVCRGTTGVG